MNFFTKVPSPGKKQQQIHCNVFTKDFSRQIDKLLNCPKFTDTSSNCITSGKVIRSNSLSSRCQEDEKKTSIGGCKMQNMYISRFMTAPCNKTVNMEKSCDIRGRKKSSCYLTHIYMKNSFLQSSPNCIINGSKDIKNRIT